MSETAERVDGPARSARARRVRIYRRIAALCAMVILLAELAIEILVFRQSLPRWLIDTPVSEGFLAIAVGWAALAIWLQVDYRRLSGTSHVGQRAEDQRVKPLMSVVRRLITLILLAAPPIALALVLTHRVSGSAYDQATAILTLSSVVNFIWITVAGIRSLLQQGKKTIR